MSEIKLLPMKKYSFLNKGLFGESDNRCC